MTEKLKKIFAESGFELTDKQCGQFETLTEYMLEYNKNVNLTRITEQNEVIEKHYLDSVLPLGMTEFPQNAKVIDVGTGAGFPSVPMKIYRNDLQFTLLDSLNKRVVYLGLLCEKLGIVCETVHARSEEASRTPEFREKFDVAVARAVANLPALCEYCLPFVKVGGIFVALKGAEDECEIAQNAVNQLGGKIEKNIPYALPSVDSRNLIIIRKIASTPTKYPRSAVNITKKPL